MGPDLWYSLTCLLCCFMCAGDRWSGVELDLGILQTHSVNITTLKQATELLLSSRDLGLLQPNPLDPL